MSILPLDDELELLHTRAYETRVYRLDDAHLLVRGGVVDEKPPGLFIAEDAEPLWVHHMVVELKIEIASLTIVDADVQMHVHPNTLCPDITDHYQKLIGLTVARGFSRAVKDLFGGPRGCAHTTALLISMGPPVMQSLWSLSVSAARTTKLSPDEVARHRDRSMANNLNTCHIWDEEGAYVELIRKGEAREGPPLPVANRLTELGMDPMEWIE